MGAQPLTVTRLDPSGGQLELTFDTATCDGNADHQVVHGFGSGLPGSVGPVFNVLGAACAIGGSPFQWSSVPDPTADASGLVWFLVQATDGGTVEGSLGRDSVNAERQGPGVGGHSGQCGNTEKDVSNSCGQ